MDYNGSLKSKNVRDRYDVCDGNVFQSLITDLGINEYTPGSDINMVGSALDDQSFCFIQEKTLDFNGKNNTFCVFLGQVESTSLLQSAGHLPQSWAPDYVLCLHKAVTLQRSLLGASATGCGVFAEQL